MLSDVLPDAVVRRHEGVARFDSIEAWVHTDIRGWTLADMIEDSHYDQLHTAAETELSAFTDPAGHVEFSAPALIATATIQEERAASRKAG